MPVEHSERSKEAEAFSNPVGHGGTIAIEVEGVKHVVFFLSLQLTNGSVWL